MVKLPQDSMVPPVDLTTPEHECQLGAPLKHSRLHRPCMNVTKPFPPCTSAVVAHQNEHDIIDCRVYTDATCAPAAGSANDRLLIHTNCNGHGAVSTSRTPRIMHFCKYTTELPTISWWLLLCAGNLDNAEVAKASLFKTHLFILQLPAQSCRVRMHD